MSATPLPQNAIYIFGNGNTSFEDFLRHYAEAIDRLLGAGEPQFILCDFRGIDTLAMEYLKTRSGNLRLLHVGERPRYLPDAFRTHVGEWQILGGYASDAQRDVAAIALCSHFLATDFNSDAQRKSGTQKNIERCLQLGKIQIL
jgi:hypothetical protein